MKTCKDFNVEICPGCINHENFVRECWVGQFFNILNIPDKNVAKMQIERFYHISSYSLYLTIAIKEYFPDYIKYIIL